MVADLAGAAPEAPAALAALVMQCLSRDPEVRPSAEQVGHQLQALAMGDAHSTGPSRDPGGNPYRGLLSFDAEHAGLFFGRDVETAQVLTELRGSPFVLVTGPSGAGESSLLRAGVIPRVLAGALGPAQWQVATMVPGGEPLERLADALAPVVGVASSELRHRLMESPPFAAYALAERGDASRLLLFIDQFEEVWTLSGGPPETGYSRPWRPSHE